MSLFFLQKFGEIHVTWVFEGVFKCNRKSIYILIGEITYPMATFNLHEKVPHYKQNIHMKYKYRSMYTEIFCFTIYFSGLFVYKVITIPTYCFYLNGYLHFQEYAPFFMKVPGWINWRCGSLISAEKPSLFCNCKKNKKLQTLLQF